MFLLFTKNYTDKLPRNTYIFVNSLFIADFLESGHRFVSRFSSCFSNKMAQLCSRREAYFYSIYPTLEGIAIEISEESIVSEEQWRANVVHAITVPCNLIFSRDYNERFNFIPSLTLSLLGRGSWDHPTEGVQISK